MPRLDNYLKETASGLRRNGIVAFAAMSTAFIALFLVGLALLIAREFSLVIEAYTGNVQVAVYLNDPVDPANVANLSALLQKLPAVSKVTYEDKAATCARFNQLFQNQRVFLENVNCQATIPTSLRVNLKDPSQYAQITAALNCTVAQQSDGSVKQVCSAPGVKAVADFSQIIDRLVSVTRVLSIGVLSVALIMLGAAVALVANTLRMGMFARRKEIGIMRLVGATNWRIRVPFLIEGLVESLLGAISSIIALFLVKVVFIDSLRNKLGFLPLIRNSDVLSVMPWILIAAVVVAVLAGTIGMRRFLDV
jgi:cell division transport system permease protein